MKRIILIVLFLMAIVFVLDHSFFVMKAGVVLFLLAFVGLLLYIITWERGK